MSAVPATVPACGLSTQRSAKSASTWAWGNIDSINKFQRQAEPRIIFWAEGLPIASSEFPEGIRECVWCVRRCRCARPEQAVRSSCASAARAEIQPRRRANMAAARHLVALVAAGCAAGAAASPSPTAGPSPRPTGSPSYLPSPVPTCAPAWIISRAPRRRDVAAALPDPRPVELLSAAAAARARPRPTPFVAAAPPRDFR